MSTVISVENVSKVYRLGMIGGGTLKEDLNRYWAKLRGKPDPTLKIGEEHHARKMGEQFWALDDVSFQVKEGEVLGIIGRNGAGKSTLLKILSQVTAPTSGEIKIKGRIASLLEVGTGFHPELTGRENVFLNGAILGMTKAEIRRKFDEIVAFSGIEEFIDTPVKRYSSGMYVRLAFAVAAHLEPEILIVAEVLAVGDAEFQKKCLGKMQDVRNEGRTVLFVSHNMGAMLNLCSRGVVLNSGGVVFNGKIEDAAEYYNRKTAEIQTREKGWEPHIVYQRNDADQTSGEYAITSVELLDGNRKPKPVISTYDSFTVRIHYSVRKHVERGSVIFQLSTSEGVTVLLLSTQPDGTLPLELEVGEHFVDCNLKNLPLAAGDYLVGAGLAIPQVEMLFWKPALGNLTVHPKDVYSSGLAPTSKRCLLVTNHNWTNSSH
jgi:lipopolysaccharide transport system ATP-binding protein